VPRRLGEAVCRIFATALLRPELKYRRQLEATFPGAGPLAGARWRALRDGEARMLRQRALVLRAALFPGWKQPVRLTGVEHVRAGLAAGRGVILWVQPCLGSTVLVKQALYEAGFPLAHLTRPGHGLSPHPFGVRIVNPFLRRAEDRFLAERIEIDDTRTVGPIRRLRTLLSQNRVISITVTTTASQLEEFEAFGGVVSLPTGPVELAASMGAVLMPVFTAASARPLVVEIGSPLPVTGRSREAVRESQEASVRWLEERIARHPGEWIGWRAGLYRRNEDGTRPDHGCPA
jgi:lauroyl/myristoyl acyltransferase